MTPELFEQLWSKDGDGLFKFSKEDVAKINMSDLESKYLYESGLPKEAAPFLTFGGDIYGSLPKVSEVWDLSNDFSRYTVIGSNESGDPICIDSLNNGEIVYLNHDYDFIRVFMNTSISQFLECLLCYQKMIDDTIRMNGADAYLDNNIPVGVKQKTISEMVKIDRVSLDNNTFWKYMLQ